MIPRTPVHHAAVLSLVLGNGMMRVGIGLAVGYVPARRATRIDPLLALRTE